MDFHSHYERARAERTLVQHVKNALRITIDWDSQAVGVPRKLTSVRFSTLSLERHFQRLMDMEDDAGYMVVVSQEKPNLCERANRLRGQHDELRGRIRSVLPMINGVPENDDGGLDAVCSVLRDLLNDIESQEHQENELLQQALAEDEGGEG
jgi:hypothetical protein